MPSAPSCLTCFRELRAFAPYARLCFCDLYFFASYAPQLCLCAPRYSLSNGRKEVTKSQMNLINILQTFSKSKPEKDTSSYLFICLFIYSHSVNSIKLLHSINSEPTLPTKLTPNPAHLNLKSLPKTRPQMQLKVHQCRFENLPIYSSSYKNNTRNPRNSWVI